MIKRIIKTVASWFSPWRGMPETTEEIERLLTGKSFLATTGEDSPDGTHFYAWGGHWYTVPTWDTADKIATCSDDILEKDYLEVLIVKSYQVKPEEWDS